MRNLLFPSVLVPLLAANTALAFERDHSAHEHGHATLSIVQEKDELQILFNSPAMNIVGFEHQPSTDEQRHKIHEAEETLKKALGLIQPNKEAKCQVEHTKVSSELLAKTDQHDDHHDEHHDHDKHHDDHHEDEHKGHDDHKDHHDDHHGHHDDHEEHEETHSEFAAEYHFECDAIDQLTSLKVELFKAFPSLEEVEVQLATSKGQKQVELNASATKIEL